MQFSFASSQNFLERSYLSLEPLNHCNKAWGWKHEGSDPSRPETFILAVGELLVPKFPTS